jgi:hypothetical protein
LLRAARWDAARRLSGVALDLCALGVSFSIEAVGLAVVDAGAVLACAY